MHAAELARPFLRVGVLDHERLISERIVRRPRSVTIGRGHGNTLTVDAPEAPRHFPLVERGFLHCWLNFTDHMRGLVRLGADGPAFTLDELAAVSEHHHGRCRVELPDGSRARLDFGDHAVLLALEAEPARPIAPMVWSGLLALALASFTLLSIALVVTLRAQVAAPTPSLAPPSAPIAAPARALLSLPPLFITVSPPLYTGAVPHALSPPPETGALRAGPSLPAVSLGPAVLGARADERSAGAASWRADGTLDPSLLAVEIERHRAAIAEAYERALKRSPTLAGRLDVRLRVGTDGHVHDVAITRDTLHAAQVSDRVRQLLVRWRLPAPSGGEVLVAFPLTFRPVTALPKIEL